MLRRLSISFIALLATACGSGTISDAGFEDARASIDTGISRPDARAPREDADVAPDAGPDADRGFIFDAEPTEDAAFDAGSIDAADAGEADALSPDTGVAPPDGGFSGMCPVPPAMVDGPFAPGPPPASANLLLTDTASNAVFRLSLDGRVLDTWSTPLRAPFGVTHDKRNTDGFFVNGRASGINGGTIYRITFGGTVTSTLNYYAPNGTIWGMDYLFGSTPELDVLGFMNLNTNSIPTISGARVRTGMRWFEGGLFQPPNVQWYGADFERYACDDGSTIVYWTTRGGNILELRDWSVNAPLRSYTIPATNDARGITRTPRGDFYVVDHQNRRVLHLAPDITLIDSFRTPGREPADLSYAE
jgi:hypothetical protein